MKPVASLILAAGGSTRLGQPKQLLYYEGRTLVRRAAEAALESGCAPVIVVLGAAQAECAEELSGLQVKLVRNVDWKLGLATSIIAGLEAVPARCGAVLISICDQINIGSGNLQAILEVYRKTGARLVASYYSGALGVPALFDASLFGELRALEGDEGARRVISHHRTELVPVPQAEAEIDIDTWADCELHGVEAVLQAAAE